MLLRFALTVVACLSYLACLGGEEMHQFGIMEHPLNKEFAAQIEKCRFDLDYCSKHTKEITLLAAKIANEHAALLLYEKVEELFSHALNQLEPKSAISQKLAHSLAVLSFARGGASQVVQCIY